jgi:uncharacterized repeat protein (TIGR01451 family)
MDRRLSLGFILFFTATSARADEPLALRNSWAGNLDFFSTGAPLATDSNNDGKVDKSAQPGKVTVGAPDLTPGAVLDTAYLYWGATRPATQCAADGLDKEVSFTPPGEPAGMVQAEACHCSSSPGYDMQLCRADVTALLGVMTGEYAVEGLDALIMNGDTNNASFAVVLVYRAPALPQRRVGLYDGLLGLSGSGTPTTTVTLGDIKISNPPQGDLTWYALEGDSAVNQNEFVQVKALPGNGVAKLGDASNPADNPFNRTINTTKPAQMGVTGVDVDRFSLAGILKAGDNTLDVTYSAGLDKYWIAFNVIGVDVFEPLFAANSSKGWKLTKDLGGDGEPSPGDTVTYTIHLENTGTAPGSVTLTDEIPAGVASWQLIDDGGGADKSVGDTLIVEGLALMPKQAVDVVLEVVIAEVADLTGILNKALLDGDGGPVELVAPELLVRRDGDADTVFDNDDNCPDTANSDQADADMNGVGDECEAVGSSGDAGSGGSSGSSGVGEGTASSGEVGTGTGGGSGTGGASTGAVDSDTPTGGAPTGGSTNGSGSSSGSGTDSAGGVDAGGCGCRGTQASGAGFLLLLGLLRRRRRV